MKTLSLSDFARQAARKSRVTFGDVRRLQRDLLPNGVATREEAEALIALDRSVRKADPAWADYLVAVIVDFVVWGTRPTGYVDPDTTRWLLASLSCESPSKTAARIVREVVREAQECDQELVAFAIGHLNQRFRPAPSAAAAVVSLAD